MEEKRLTLTIFTAVTFGEIKVGYPFYMRGRFWIKTSSTAAFRLLGYGEDREEGDSSLIDPSVKVSHVLIGRQ